jgi:uncharacterized protein YcbK (DUF882 family)
MINGIIEIIKMFLGNSRSVAPESIATNEDKPEPKKTEELPKEEEKKKPETSVKKLITIEEVLMGRVKFEELPEEHQKNIEELVEKINKLFEGYSWPKQLPKKVNDGYRRPQDNPKNGSATSWHFKGAAIDLDDDDSGITWKYVWANRRKLKELGIYVEHPCWTHHKAGTWVHLQIKAPKSGKRFFIPSTQPNPNPSFWDGKYEADLDN